MSSVLLFVLFVVIATCFTYFICLSSVIENNILSSGREKNLIKALKPFGTKDLQKKSIKNKRVRKCN